MFDFGNNDGTGDLSLSEQSNSHDSPQDTEQAKESWFRRLFSKKENLEPVEITTNENWLNKVRDKLFGKKIVLSDNKALAIVPNEGVRKGVSNITRISDNDFTIESQKLEPKQSWFRRLFQKEEKIVQPKLKKINLLNYGTPNPEENWFLRFSNKWFGKPAPNLDISEDIVENKRPLSKLVEAENRVDAELNRKASPLFNRIFRGVDKQDFIAIGSTPTGDNKTGLKEKLFDKPIPEPAAIPEPTPSIIEEAKKAKPYSRSWVSRVGDVFSDAHYSASSTVDGLVEAGEKMSKGVSKAGELGLIMFGGSAALGALVGLGKTMSKAEMLTTQRKFAGLEPQVINAPA